MVTQYRTAPYDSLFEEMPIDTLDNLFFQDLDEYYRTIDSVGLKARFEELDSANYIDTLKNFIKSF